MNTRSLGYLAGATVLVAVVAAVTLNRRESAVRATSESGTLFPSLSASINEVTSIELKRKDGVTTLQRIGDGWGLAEKSAYPVDIAAVRKTLIGLSELAGSEPKTEDPKMYSKIGVEDPGTEGSTSTLVTLKDAGGKEVASVIVGKEHASKTFSGPPQLYVRKPGEARSWLARGDIDIKEKGTDWLDKKILEVKRERIRAAEIRHADGEVVLVDRDKPETKDFTLHEVPEGKEVSYPSAPSSLADALGYLNLEDVVSAGELDMKEGASGTAKFSCFDGLTITVTTKTVGEKTYARFEASYETPPESSGPPAPPDGETKADATGDGEKPVEAEVEGAEKPAPKNPEEVQKEAAALNERLSKWVYVIPTYNKSSFEKRKSELLKDKAPPAPAPGTGEAAPEAEDGTATPPAKPPSESKPPEKDSKSPPPTPPKEDEAKPETPPESKPPRFGVSSLG